MEKLKETEGLKWKYLYPISAILFLVPLIVHMKMINLTPAEIELWGGQTESIDFFAYNKMMILNIGAIVSMMLCFFYLKRKDTKIKKTTIYIPMTIYAVFIILSTLMSDQTQIALRGFSERYEGMYSLLSYIVLMFIAINMVDGKMSIKAIMYPLIASATIIGIIGVFQYLGYDFFQTQLGRSIIIPLKHMKMANEIRFNFGKHTIYSTLYNTNYVGSYMSMLFSITLTTLILIKNKKKKIILTPITILMFLNLIGSNSRGGIIGTAFAMIILIIMLRKTIKNNWKMALSSLIILSIAFTSIDMVSGGRASNQIKRLKTDIAKIFSQDSQNNIDEYKIKELTSQGTTLKIVTTDETLKIKYEDDDFKFLDENNKEIELGRNEAISQAYLLDDKYDRYGFRFGRREEISDKISIIQLDLDGYTTMFIVEDEEFKHYTISGVTKEIKEVESYGFEGKETLGSSRGYIWSRSIPMLKQNIILGYGPDTYALHFPQEDFVGVFNGRTSLNNIIVDKPHNLYLQKGINTGVLSLIAFLSIAIMYFIQSFKIYFKANFDNVYEIIGLSIFIAFCGYMISGVFNDSVVSVASVFWILLGAGVGINYKLNNEAIEHLE